MMPSKRRKRPPSRMAIAVTTSIQSSEAVVSMDSLFCVERICVERIIELCRRRRSGLCLIGQGGW